MSYSIGYFIYSTENIDFIPESLLIETNLENYYSHNYINNDIEDIVSMNGFEIEKLKNKMFNELNNLSNFKEVVKLLEDNNVDFKHEFCIIYNDSI